MKKLALGLGLALCGSSVAVAAVVDPAQYSTLRWRLVGPFRGGWVSAIEGVPDRPDTFYFASAGGGVWKTQNAGRTWMSLFDKGGSSAIGAIVVAPSNPDVVYVGGGQPEPRYDVQSGRGVYRTTDGGKTWTDLGLADTRYIAKIWVSPSNPDEVVVAAVGHFFGESEARGLYRSTDGGKHWTHVLSPGPYTGANDIVADPVRPTTLFASTWEARQWPWQSYFTEISGPGSALYRSDDSGAHWTKVEGTGWPKGPLGRISLASGHTKSGLRLYAMIDSREHAGLWRSDDAGKSWRRVNSLRAGAGYYFNRIFLDPADPDKVYMMGQSMRLCVKGGTECDIFRGSPGGDDYHGIWINPKHPERVASAADQGAAISVDGKRTWSDWYNQPTGQFYHVTTDDRFPYWIYSGQQDSGTVGIASRSDYGAPNLRDWHPVGGDERDDDVPDPDDPDTIFGSGLGGKVSRWHAPTGNVADVSPWPVGNYGLRPTTVEHHFNWVTPLVVSRAGPTTLYLGGEILFASKDKGKTWKQFSPDLTGKRKDAPNCVDAIAIPDAAACGYGTITTIQPSPLDAAEIWAGSDSGLAHVTRDGGATWANLPLPGIKPWTKVSSIDQGYRDRRAVYLALDGQRIDDWHPHVLRSRDGGTSWQEVNDGLPRDEIVSVVRTDPVRDGLLYAGTETAVYVSFDDGDHWQPLRLNMPTAWARDLTVHGDDLVVGTQGRAIWILGDLALLRQIGAEHSASPATLFAPAPAYRLRLNNNHDTPLAPETPAGENPPQGAIIDYWLGTPPSGPVTLDIRNSAGQSVRRFSSNDRPEQLVANRYFQKEWVKPEAMLPASPGAHRWIWNLRAARPKAVEYQYSIAAIWGLGTPLQPEGQLVPPGRYEAVLSANGREYRQPIEVKADPRVTDANYPQAWDFSMNLYAPMAKAWSGHLQSAWLRDELQRRMAAIKDPALADQAKALGAKLEPSQVPNSGFDGESATLSALEGAAEAADIAPTRAMRDIASKTMQAIDADWVKWTQIREGELAAFNRALVAAGLAPVVIPSDAVLNAAAVTG
jgi:photosystem II stability/assembly factor-like uncharacterized protein